MKPTHVLNAAGVTGRPNVDWCETHRQETIRANVLGCLTLADVAAQRGIHMTYYGTGCIFHYDADFPQGSGKGFMESDTPNFTGSYYSHTKAMVENLLKEYPNVLTLRIRMPIVADLVYPRNFIAKIIKYDKVRVCGRGRKRAVQGAHYFHRQPGLPAHEGGHGVGCVPCWRLWGMEG